MAKVRKCRRWMGLLAWGVVGFGARVGWGADPASGPAVAGDKSQYTLFNPVPREMMRPLSTDRPSVTDSPYTVDAGHYQVELSFVEYTEQRGAEGGETWSVLPTNLKAGVLNDLDVQLVLNPYESVRTRDAGRSEGFGDMQVRGKLNLWGDDGGTTAGAVIAFVQVPTGTGGVSNHHVEGGFSLPLDVSLPGDFTLGVMAEFNVDRNEENTGYGVNFVHSAVLSHAVLVKELEAYVEYAGVSPMGTGETYQAFVDTGLTYLVTPNVQLDVGVNVGLSGGAEGYMLVTGLSFRM